ncbi:Hypothetical_protein [Hexamita inflata]|uniref:Hypothetical_protein n=1 Tax=Hexamita inflata TaxID=28002 RepID=A0ABP1IKD9_9EUKA
MVNKILAMILNIMTAVCLSLLILSALIVIIAHNISTDQYFKTAFFIICCVFQIIAPWVKFAQVYFKFMIHPFWRAGFIFLLGMFQFPGIQQINWNGGYVYLYFFAIVVMILSIVHLGLAIVDYKLKRNTYSEVNNV